MAIRALPIEKTKDRNNEPGQKLLSPEIESKWFDETFRRKKQRTDIQKSNNEKIQRYTPQNGIFWLLRSQLYDCVSKICHIVTTRKINRSLPIQFYQRFAKKFEKKTIPIENLLTEQTKMYFL